MQDFNYWLNLPIKMGTGVVFFWNCFTSQVLITSLKFMVFNLIQLQILLGWYVFCMTLQSVKIVQDC